MLVTIKKQAPDGKIPKGLLLEGRPAIKDIFKEFERSKTLDRENEKYPAAGKSPSPMSSYKRML